MRIVKAALTWNIDFQTRWQMYVFKTAGFKIFYLYAFLCVCVSARDEVYRKEAKEQIKSIAT